MFEKNEIVEIANLLLQTIVTTYGEHQVDLPARRYLSVGGLGSTVHDCEQVTVSFEQGYSGLPGNQAQEPVKCNSPRTGVFIVEVVRALPLPNTTANKTGSAVPSRYKTGADSSLTVSALEPETLTQVAEKQMIDAMLMMEAGLRAGETTITGTLVDVSAGQPQGGYQAMVMTVAASAVKTAL